MRRTLLSLCGSALLFGCGASVETSPSSTSGGMGGAQATAAHSVAASSSTGGFGGTSSTSVSSTSASTAGGTPCGAASDCPPSATECALPACQGGVCVTVNADVATTCNGTCNCDGAGACAGPGCVTDAICPVPPNACVLSKCFGCEMCVLLSVPSGTIAPGDVKGDCKRPVCDGAGNVVVAVDDTDVPDDGDPCTQDLCTNGVPSHAPLCPAPQTCNQGVCSP